MSGRSLYRTADDDPVYRAMDQHYDQRAIYRRRIEALVAQGIEYERAVNNVLPPGTQVRAWWDS